MQRCPLCRATLNGAETCRRCRAELEAVQRVEREGQTLVDAAIHHLSLDDAVTAARLLRRALALHVTPEARALWGLLKALSAQSDARGHCLVRATFATRGPESWK
jgi:hypothetical protein